MRTRWNTEESGHEGRHVLQQRRRQHRLRRRTETPLDLTALAAMAPSLSRGTGCWSAAAVTHAVQLHRCQVDWRSDQEGEPIELQQSTSYSTGYAHEKKTSQPPEAEQRLKTMVNICQVLAAVGKERMLGLS